MFSLYQLINWIILPLAILRLLIKSRIEPKYRENLAERFGFAKPSKRSPVIWLHAVSVGEMLASEQLVKHLIDQFQEFNVLITCTTPGGREVALKINSDKINVAYLPFDLTFFVSRFIKCYRPACLLVMETEIWPAIFTQCSKESIPIFALNARLSEKSMHRYLRIKGLTKKTISCASAVLAQTKADAARLNRVGASKVIVSGNLKYDRRATADQLELGQQFRELFGISRPIILAASTHEGEESPIIDDFLSGCPPQYLLVIVPRHSRRFSRVMQLMRTKDPYSGARSKNNPISEKCRLVLGDSMGEMYSYLTCSDIVIMGGSFAPLGGQNPIEALSLGKQVITGPSTHNFDEVVRQGSLAGVVHQVQNTKETITVANALLLDEHVLGLKKKIAMGFTEKNAGALKKTMAYLISQRQSWREY